ncbi:MAG TPA: ABC transporter permease [Pirellulales bacterium]|jgi:phospholipid/cholesterol/gamma-HCH transport system permease protein|nr:ABC transporter permease [Pirellulales bacterium]
MSPDTSLSNPARRWGYRPIEALRAWISDLGRLVFNWLTTLGEIGIFSLKTMQWMMTHLPRRDTLMPSFYQIGVLSLPVVALTGTFIGMVLAVQSYSQFHALNLETHLGAIINVSLVRELGPVLAATMLAGRVGSAMAAELGTMRVTEQIDALTSMGANPIYYLVVPRFLGCLVLIPTLTIMADFMGVVGGAFYSIVILNIDSHHYWENAQRYVGAFDLFSGVFKSLSFGAAIALISCHRGFHCDPGAEGVGRAATNAFVYSFVVILILDLLLGIATDGLNYALWPDGPKMVYQNLPQLWTAVAA